MGLRIPPHLQDAEKNYGVRKGWVEHKRFNREAYFTAIDDFKQRVQGVIPGGDPISDASLVRMISIFIEEEQLLEGYITGSRGPQLSSEDDWARVVTATAWYVLQRYEREVKRGDWP